MQNYIFESLNFVKTYYKSVESFKQTLAARHHFIYFWYEIFGSTSD